MRNAQEEAKRNKPPRAFRELYREVLAAAQAGGESAIEDEDGDIDTD